MACLVDKKTIEKPQVESSDKAAKHFDFLKTKPKDGNLFFIFISLF